jgi:hypothetical protein
MHASRIQGHTSDDLAALSPRGETLVSRPHEDLLELTPARSLQDLVIALVALLVALVHHRGSYSVTLRNRTGMVPSARQKRRSL